MMGAFCWIGLRLSVRVRCGLQPGLVGGSFRGIEEKNKI